MRIGSFLWKFVMALRWVLVPVVGLVVWHLTSLFFQPRPAYTVTLPGWYAQGAAFCGNLLLLTSYRQTEQEQIWSIHTVDQRGRFLLENLSVSRSEMIQLHQATASLGKDEEPISVPVLQRAGQRMGKNDHVLESWNLRTGKKTSLRLWPGEVHLLESGDRRTLVELSHLSPGWFWVLAPSGLASVCGTSVIVQTTSQTLGVPRLDWGIQLVRVWNMVDARLRSQYALEPRSHYGEYALLSFDGRWLLTGTNILKNQANVLRARFQVPGAVTVLNPQLLIWSHHKRGSAVEAVGSLTIRDLRSGEKISHALEDQGAWLAGPLEAGGLIELEPKGNPVKAIHLWDLESKKRIQVSFEDARQGESIQAWQRDGLWCYLRKGVAKFDFQFGTVGPAGHQHRDVFIPDMGSTQVQLVPHHNQAMIRYSPYPPSWAEHVAPWLQRWGFHRLLQHLMTTTEYLGLYDCDSGTWMYAWPAPPGSTQNCEFRLDGSQMLLSTIDAHSTRISIYDLPLTVRSPVWSIGIGILAAVCVFSSLMMRAMHRRRSQEIILE